MIVKIQCFSYKNSFTVLTVALRALSIALSVHFPLRTVLWSSILDFRKTGTQSKACPGSLSQLGSGRAGI